MSPIVSGGSAGSAIGSSLLIYRFTVSGSDKASIDTGADTTQAGTNDWTNGDMIEVLFVGRTDEATPISALAFTFNNDGGGNYDNQLLTGANATASASVGAAATSVTGVCPGTTAGASYAGVTQLWLPDYIGTSFFKAGVMWTGQADATAGNNIMRGKEFGWRNTAAITRLAVATVTGGQKLKVGSQLSIYKRLAAAA